MQLLDASLAFALTLAAFATVVTIIMEAYLRIVRMKKKNLVEVIKKLNDELGQGPLNLSPEERLNFFSKVVENPFNGINLGDTIDWSSKKNKETILSDFISKFDKTKNLKGNYKKVTLEFVLRCLAESETVKTASLEASDRLKTELNRIARKYEDLGSSVSARFKEHAQMYSIAIGVILALTANIDGLRIFDAYRTDPKLALAVIEKQESLIEKNQEIQAAMKSLNELYLREDEKKGAIDTAESGKKSADEINRLKAELQQIPDKISESPEITAIQKSIQEAKNQVVGLRNIGVPIGWDYYPNCKDIISENEEKDCKGFWACILTTFISDFPGFMAWVLRVFVTGILIGLGAPFWFDVAKRLSQIRTGLKNPNASDEDRLAARDANGDTDERKKIVNDVVKDTLREAGVSAFGQPSKFMGPKGIVL